MDVPDEFAIAPDVDAMVGACLPTQRKRTEEDLAKRSMRALHVAEIEVLRAQGNSAEDWARVKVAKDFVSAAIFHSRFEGHVDLGCMGGEAELCFGSPSGIYHSTLRDCRVGEGVRIARCGLIARQVIGGGACIEDVGRMEVRGELASFGNELALFHEELFSRRVRAVAELPFAWAAWLSGPGASDIAADVRKKYEVATEDYAAKMRSDRGYVAAGCRIFATALIENCWIGEGVEIEAAGSLRNCTIWGTPSEPTMLRDGVHVRNCLIGPGCVIERGATLEDSLLFEQVFVGQQAIIHGCAIGPNSRLSASEANDSLLGPFTMAIHHGLILAAWWPEGKGNIAYGSNVGSNHTGRAPDQEIFPGEGVFFGLGCNVKFPCNFRHAPYTIIASGVNVLPQSVYYPFSLITQPTRTLEGISPALNEIQPGWGILKNAYGIERQERNMAHRLRARRQSVDTRILRTSMIPGMENAMHVLSSHADQNREFITTEQIPGLGKNYMTEAARQDGVAAYSFGIKLIISRAILDGTVDQIPDWRILAGLEGEKSYGIEEAIQIQRQWIAMARESRARDDQRGVKIIPDYAARHFGVSNDPVIAAMEKDLAEQIQRAAENSKR